MFTEYVIREMFQKTYVIRDLNENRLVIRDRDPPFTTLSVEIGKLELLAIGMDVSLIVD